MLGPDAWNGSPAQVQGFRNATGVDFPLLLDAGDLVPLYGPYHNFIVVDGDGIIRYTASDTYGHGNRYHRDEIRAVVDAALATPIRERSWGAIKNAFTLP